jgi:hypothetical protein
VTAARRASSTTGSSRTSSDPSPHGSGSCSRHPHASPRSPTTGFPSDAAAPPPSTRPSRASRAAGARSPSRTDRRARSSPGWQKLRIDADDAGRHFAGDANIGVLLGEPSRLARRRRPRLRRGTRGRGPLPAAHRLRHGPRVEQGEPPVVRGRRAPHAAVPRSRSTAR